MPRAVPRDPASAEERARILVATRALLADEHAGSAFTLDAIASRAGVARAGMQRQFGTLAGVCEALWDELLSAGCLIQLPRALALADPFAALDELIAIHARFWHAERRVLRRLRALAALDAELERALLQREQDRRAGLRKLALRLHARSLQLPATFSTVDVLAIATSFETFEGIAGTEHGTVEVTAALQALARAALGGS
jgi:AcrR family transcriptional regulator